ncbi:MarR family winged helix-turn-helix transcriptional regulator [Nocardiopsis composta]|uniref:HTH marR-type domain-containing protein n=1 Tax=Nocardiopsis composta TaxID=157465 RepID=A0A7W8QI21_9ACTN|nr:winged helix DNA-binding protein [Nocardiopsis composta]MBB5430670.1 hypothetical protein [Nocardiopsis composta]
MHQPEPVRFLNRERSTVSVTLGGMERAGLLARSPSPTHRTARVVELTDRGRRVCRQAWDEREERTFGALGAEQRSEPAGALTAIRGALRSCAPSERPGRGRDRRAPPAAYPGRWHTASTLLPSGSRTNAPK